jgi:hypothetical protein
MVRPTAIVPILLLFSTACLALELDESPPNPGDWGFRPLEGASAVLNPPGFSWRPVDGASFYRLQISDGQDFSSLLLDADNLPWSAYCPSETLPAGRLYWRYAAADASGEISPWSRARTFQVGAGSVPFPKPSRERIAALIPREHPRLFITNENLAGLRDLSSGPLKSRHENLLKQAQDLIDNPPDTSEPPLYPEGLEHESAEWKKIWWGNRTRGIRVADGAATLGFVYRLTGERRYAEAGKKLLLAVMDWDPEGSTQYRYNDEAAMPLVYFPSRAYTFLEPVLTDRERQKVVEVMRIRGRQTFEELHGNNHLWRPYNSHRNRAWHFLGELGIVFHDEIPEAPDWLDYALTVFYTAYPAWGGVDGGWSEGTAYWISYLQRFLFWEAAMRTPLGIDVFDIPFFQKTGYYGMYVLPPGTEAGAFGDQAALVGSNRIGDFMAELAAGARNPHWKWYADKVGGQLPDSYLGFLRAARSADLEPQPPTDLPSSRFFSGAGVATLNSNLLSGTDNVQIHFKSSPMGRQSHGFNGNNTFLLNVAGKRVFVQSGERDISGSPHHTEWMWESKSDNNILVNGAGQKKHSSTAVGEIVQFETHKRYDVIVGEAAESYPDRLTRFTRRLVFLKPDVVVIQDILEATAPATFQWTLHGAGKFELVDQRAVWDRPPAKVAVDFLEPAGLALSQTGQFDPPPAEWSNIELDQWHLLAETPQPARTREFLTLIRIGDAPRDWEVRKGTDSSRVLVLRGESGSSEIELGSNHLGLRIEDQGELLQWSSLP